MWKFVFAIGCSFIVNHLFSQDIEYARKTVDTLSSAYFAGRGAAGEGEKKAADYLVKEFKRQGLKAFDDNYIQTFNYPINTFEGALSVQLDNTSLIAGRDFIVGGNSNGTNGTFDVVWYYKKNIPTKKQLKKLTDRNFFTDKFIVIDEKGIDKDDEAFQMLKYNLVSAVGVVFLEDRLTKDLATTYEDYVVLKIKRDKINRKQKVITVEVNQKFKRHYQSQNIIGFIEGAEQPDSFIVISAHYDHLGKMGGEVYFPGANDNASGVAMLLNLAFYYTHKNPPAKTMVFIAFGAEEAGIIGSKYFIDHPNFELKKVNFELNLDVIGTGKEGLMVVNGAVYNEQFEKLLQINAERNYVPTVKKRGKAANSDHYWFTEKGIPSFFIYALGGIKAYHDVADIAKTLPLTFFENNFRLIRDFIDEL